MNKNSKLNLKNKVCLYKAIIRPTMTYASEIFKHANPNLIKKLQATQNVAIRQCTNSPYYITNDQIHKETDTPSIHEFITKLATNTYDKMSQHDNNLVRKAINYDPLKTTKFKRPRQMINDEPQQDSNAMN